ncbi:hypothetical protein V8B97DRAFT_1915158 [Scleroderma yunnanense]
MSVKKSTSGAKSSTKKTATRPPPTHPSWIDMIKSLLQSHPPMTSGGHIWLGALSPLEAGAECITANTEDSRQGVSRPHIKKYVEERYQLQIGNAQNTQLARAIATGAEKGIFVLPKGPSGRVKLPPKTSRPADTSASKENKPAKAPASKSTTKARPAKTASTKATTTKSAATKKAAPKAKATDASARKSTDSRTAKPTSKSASATKAKDAAVPKKTLAGKKAAPVKKTTSTSKRGAAKKAITGVSASARAKAKAAAAKKSVKKAAPRASATSKKV